MKKIACEMCGGELIKDSGVFVCQNCGCKYSVEEAKKMMVDVTGSTVNVANQAQEDNLLKMARTSMDSKNYKDVENFCNQIIAMNANNYEAWKLKASAINWLATGLNTRISECFNCLINAFQCVKEDETKQNCSQELDNEFKQVYTSEFNFRFNNFSKMPGEKQFKILSDVIYSFVNNGLKTMLEIGIDENNASKSYQYVINDIISRGFRAMNDAWLVVGEKYYKEDFNDLGASWKKTDYYFDLDHRPDEHDFNDFIDGTEKILDLGKLIVGLANDETDNTLLKNIYTQMIKINCLAKDSCSYDTYWGGSDGFTQKWCVEYTLTDDSKSIRNDEIKQWKKEVNNIKEKENEEKKRIADEKKAQEEAAQKEKEAKQKAANDKYWADHAELQQSLIQKREAILTIIKSLENKNSEIDSNIKHIQMAIFSSTKTKDEIETQKKYWEKLNSELKQLGVFKFRKKKEVSEKIKLCCQTIYKLNIVLDAEIKRFEEKKIEDIKPLKAEIMKNEGLIIEQKNILKKIEDELNGNY